MKKEKIICAAIWFDDDISRPNQSVYSGFIITGLRHSNCYHAISTIDPHRKYLKFKQTQGFITNENRFVDRKEALSIAISARQVNQKKLHNPSIGLFSEDIY